jgi:hypothetical protein
MSNKVGRPPKYDTPEALQTQIDNYFKSIEGTEDKPRIAALVLYCDFCDIASFYDYENKPEFTKTIKKARTRIVDAYEKKLDGKQVAGPIFALKNLGWSDRQDITVQGTQGIKFVMDIGDGKNKKNRKPAD